MQVVERLTLKKRREKFLPTEVVEKLALKKRREKFLQTEVVDVYFTIQDRTITEHQVMLNRKTRTIKRYYRSVDEAHDVFIRLLTKPKKEA